MERDKPIICKVLIYSEKEILSANGRKKRSKQRECNLTDILTLMNWTEDKLYDHLIDGNEFGLAVDLSKKQSASRKIVRGKSPPRKVAKIVVDIEDDEEEEEFEFI